MRKFNIKIFADGAKVDVMRKMNELDYVSGFTTNPSLLKQAGVTDYISFAKQIVKEFYPKPISLEVINDSKEEMVKEARILSALGQNVFVKIPVVNFKGETTYDIISKLSSEGIRLNITAVFTIKQVENIKKSLSPYTDNIISIFAGRIADTGRNASVIVKEAVEQCANMNNIEILWASCREVFNIIEAENSGCHIITITEDVMHKLKYLDKDMDEFSKETAKMFHDDAFACGFVI